MNANDSVFPSFHPSRANTPISCEVSVSVRDWLHDATDSGVTSPPCPPDWLPTVEFRFNYGSDAHMAVAVEVAFCGILLGQPFFSQFRCSSAARAPSPGTTASAWRATSALRGCDPAPAAGRYFRGQKARGQSIQWRGIAQQTDPQRRRQGHQYAPLRYIAGGAKLNRAPTPTKARKSQLFATRTSLTPLLRMVVR